MKTGNSQNTGPKKTVEPATTHINEGKLHRILMELPGIPEEKIKIDLENQSTSVTILASDAGILYKKVITIPCEVRFRKKRFSDGVLELTLERNES